MKQSCRLFTGKSAKHKRHSRILRWFAAGLFVLLLTAVISAVICQSYIQVKSYTIKLSGLDQPVRLAMIADLHGLEFGPENERLVRKMAEQQPAAIFLAGDMVNRDGDRSEVDRLIHLIHEFENIAPVYFSPGNHENDYMKRDPSLLDRIAESGANVVNDSFLDVGIGGQLFRIGGTTGHAFPFGRDEEAFEQSPEYRFLREFEQAQWPKICLAHLPDTFIFNGAYSLWDVDLVLSGHTHGGVIRLPLLGGLYAPMQGFFPEYDQSKP